MFRESPRAAVERALSTAVKTEKVVMFDYKGITVIVDKDTKAKEKTDWLLHMLSKKR